MLGTTQKTWFKSELLAAAAANQFIVWASESPWVATSDTDTWYGYQTERTELSTYFKTNSLTGRMCILSADRHASGIDNGANNNFATGGGGGVKAFMASPFDRSALVPSGTYSQGTYNGSGNVYGVMEVTDNGGSSIDIDWTLKAYGLSDPLSYFFSATIA
jgi:hypothetical protein